MALVPAANGGRWEGTHAAADGAVESRVSVTVDNMTLIGERDG